MLARNTFANYVGQGYTTLVGVVIMPLYLNYLDPEAFGLIGFFTLLSTWLHMLTVGLSPTLGRQVAVFRARKQLASEEFRDTLRSLEVVIFIIGLVISVSIWFSSDWIVHCWLHPKTLHTTEAGFAVGIMGLITAFRWGVSLYTSGMIGLEEQIWLNGFNIGVATARNIGGLLWIAFISPSIGSYFIYQGLLSVIELIVIGTIFYARQPEKSRDYDPGLAFSRRHFVKVLPFALSTAYSSLIWVFITQFDKLLLSNLLSLELFGYFSFVVMLSNGVLRIADPVNQAVLPRLTVLLASDNREESLKLFRTTTQFLAVLSISTSSVIATFAPQTLYLLTGNSVLTNYGAPALVWYALGNGVLVVASVLFTLQAAFGQLRLHVINTTVSALIQVPLMAFVAIHFSVTTLGFTWFILRVLIFAIFSSIIFRRFRLNFFHHWLRDDVLRPFFGAMTGLAIARSIDISFFQSQQIQSRGILLLLMLLYGGITVMSAAFISTEVRSILLAFIRRAYRQYRF